MKFKSIILLFIFPVFVYSQKFGLKNFLEYHPSLQLEVDKIFDSLNDTLRVGQLIVPAVGRLGKTDEHVIELCKKGKIGGVLLLFESLGVDRPIHKMFL